MLRFAKPRIGESLQRFDPSFFRHFKIVLMLSISYILRERVYNELESFLFSFYFATANEAIL
jgi:hypothetical protein